MEALAVAVVLICGFMVDAAITVGRLSPRFGMVIILILAAFVGILAG